MNDAIVLLAMSQIICLAAIAYLYSQVQALRPRGARVRPTASMRVQPIQETVTAHQQAKEDSTRVRPQPPLVTGGRSGDALALLARLQESGMDIPALAKRMRRSEEEVRLLLRRQGMGR